MKERKNRDRKRLQEFLEEDGWLKAEAKNESKDSDFRKNKTFKKWEREWLPPA